MKEGTSQVFLFKEIADLFADRIILGKLIWGKYMKLNWKCLWKLRTAVEIENIITGRHLQINW